MSRNAMSFCAIDFGTSNSAVAIRDGAAMRLVELEAGYGTLPTAVFFNADEGGRATFGRQAVADYIDGYDGRLMRSLKSLLGSSLIESTTDLGNGSAMRYIDIIGTFLRHLRTHAVKSDGSDLRQVVMGRPVFFVDDDPKADTAAQRSLEQSARDVGFQDVHFQFEPIAAAFDYESRLTEEQQVLVVDIGGGTSDFSLVRVGPDRARRLERKDDVLAHHGVHIAGTDFDRRIELATILRELGYKALGPDGKEVPNRIYFDLATWHLINTVYTPKRAGELALTAHLYADPVHHRRLMRTVEQRLGHALVGHAEDAKIAVAARCSVLGNRAGRRCERRDRQHYGRCSAYRIACGVARRRRRCAVLHGWLDRLALLVRGDVRGLPQRDAGLRRSPRQRGARSRHSREAGVLLNRSAAIA
jgi:hypothetical chaperone protein